MVKRRKKAPKGYHYMPDGRLMKNSAHKKKKKKRRWRDVEYKKIRKQKYLKSILLVLQVEEGPEELNLLNKFQQYTKKVGIYLLNFWEEGPEHNGKKI